MKIREAVISDALDVLNWRNDPLSCQMFTNNNTIALEEHKKWFESGLINSSRKLYIGIIKKEKVGICRFDLDKLTNISEVSINLNPSMRGKNLSYELLFNSIKIYRKNNFGKLAAKIKKENEASLKIFEKCGFSRIDENGTFYYLTAF
jgi:RimJ/RimL family protein N-acetyltransferase